MSPQISPLSVVHPQAELADDVEIGPFCTVGPHVKLGTGTVLESHVVLTGHTTIGRYNRFAPNCVIGHEPQDVSFKGAPTRLEIGDHNLFREGVTVNRGAEKEDHVTRIGNRNLLMSNAHVAHNCHIRDNTIIVNGVLLGGHVHVYDWAIVSGNTVVHHFTSIGTMSFISGGCRVTVDMPPYMLACGSEKLKIFTVNLIGLQRRGIAPETIKLLKRAHRLLYRDYKKLDAARSLLTEEAGGTLPPELVNLFQFIEAQNQGKDGRGREAIRRRAAA